MQGARLTSFELHAAGVDVTLICDNMSGTVMKQGLVQAVFVGCDGWQPMETPQIKSEPPLWQR